MSDLVERLRQLARQLATGDNFHNDRLLTAEDTMYWKAADRITELTRLIEHIWLHVTSDEDFSADELRRDIEKLGATDELKGAIAAREAAEAERDTATRALRELFAFVWDHVRTGSQIDSFDAQHKLAELELIRLEPVRTADEESEWGETELWYPTALVENQEPVT